jgi:ArsR family transcriptional regulator
MATSLIPQTVLDSHTPLNSQTSLETLEPSDQNPSDQNSQDNARQAQATELLCSQESREDLVQVFKLLSSGPRLQIIAHLVREGELNVTDLCHRIHQTQPAVSHHLALLRLNKLLVLRREGKHSFYSVNPSRLQGVLQNLADIVLGQNADELEMSDFRLTRVG